MVGRRDVRGERSGSQLPAPLDSTLTGLDRGHLKEYYLDVVDYTEKMLDRWQPGEQICLVKELERFAVKFASKIYFGQEPEEHHQNFAAISREITAKLVSPTTLMPVRFPGSPYMKFLELTQQAETSIMAEVTRHMTHRDPELFEQPKRFLPERWDAIEPSPFEYLPFSYGARKCLGAAFAEMLLKIVTSMIVQRYRLELIPKSRIDLKVTFILNFKNGLPVIVREQDREPHRSQAEIRGQLRELVAVS